ncbi:ABC-2 type transport system permease protein [Chitinophaga polysaccharea]|uniref:ABC-2 type transport system permease protein n=1 Tax=Chitinophaga polysaccharea TaxID=1293035 RepID=A0A561Q4I1_9BACT|nr:ABC transporter permease [Chitinophaga polysaccharea]TWF45265.1 ABC-2 type transport system permease protein [Chitinophaga polysaccharea]
MEKIWLIIKREFITRVRKKSFLVTTLLVPLAFAAMIIVPILLATSSSEHKLIAVVDNSQLFENKFPDSKGVYFKYLHQQNIDSLKQHYEELGYEGVLYIPEFDINRPSGFEFYSSGQASVTMESSINSDINSIIEKKRMELQGIDQSKLDGIKSDVEVTFKNGKEGKKGSSWVAYGVGYASGFIIYFILLLFGTSVMRGVMEEKVSRIAEVMISSVKPFQLMMGKIIGIAAVGLLQFLIWGVLITAIYSLIPLFVSPESMQAAAQGSQAMSQSEQAEVVRRISEVVGSIQWSLLLPCFVLYFLGGYLFYSSLYAAIGSLANEDAADIQQLTIPVTVPIIIGIMIMMKAVHDPTSSLAVWGSIIPFTSPMVMMARLPYGVPGTVPYWQLGLSFVFLIGGFMTTTWAAGRIYRTGILMYGKKITLKEAMKWVVRKP